MVVLHGQELQQQQEEKEALALSNGVSVDATTLCG